MMTNDERFGYKYSSSGSGEKLYYAQKVDGYIAELESQIKNTIPVPHELMARIREYVEDAEDNQKDTIYDRGTTEGRESRLAKIISDLAEIDEIMAIRVIKVLKARITELETEVSRMAFLAVEMQKRAAEAKRGGTR